MNRDMIAKQWMKESLLLLFLVTVVIAFALPRSLFGMDMEDEGWLLTAYQNIFSHPSSVSYNFLYYNGIVAGGIWNLLFGQYGLVAFRVMHVLLEVLKALLVYFLLRKYCNKYTIAVGFIIYEIVFNAYTFTDHNQVSALLCLLAIFFIVKSLEQNKWLYMLVGGAVVGINVFTRIPNIAFCALILVLVVYWIDTHNHRETLYLFLSAIGGFIIGCLMEMMLMCCLGHFNIFVDNIACGLSASGDADSTHNLASMGKMYFTQLRDLWYQIAPIALLGCVFWYTKKKLQPINKNVYFCVLIGLSLLTVALAYHQHRSLMDSRLYALLTIIGIYIILYAPSMYKYIATLGLLFIYMMPLGSDWGYWSNIIYQGMCLSLPFTIAYLLTELSKRELQKEIFMFPISLFAFIVFGYSTYKGVKHYIRDCRNLSPTVKKCDVHSPLATAIFIGDYWSTRLNPLLDEMAKYVQPGDVVLCYQSLAMVHYLTKTRPYLENAWPWTYTSGDMEKHFVKAQTESDVLPVIVREKGWVCDIFNEDNYPDWDNSEAIENRFHKNKKIKLIQNFIKDNNYTVVWEDKAFQILVPPTLKE